jgi:hypothetical protein
MKLGEAGVVALDEGEGQVRNELAEGDKAFIGVDEREEDAAI